MCLPSQVGEQLLLHTRGTVKVAGEARGHTQVVATDSETVHGTHAPAIGKSMVADHLLEQSIRKFGVRVPGAQMCTTRCSGIRHGALPGAQMCTK